MSTAWSTGSSGRTSRLPRWAVRRTSRSSSSSPASSTCPVARSASSRARPDARSSSSWTGWSPRRSLPGIRASAYDRGPAASVVSDDPPSWAIGSVVRARGSHPRGHWFESSIAHHLPPFPPPGRAPHATATRSRSAAASAASVVRWPTSSNARSQCPQGGSAASPRWSTGISAASARARLGRAASVVPGDASVAPRRDLSWRAARSASPSSRRSRPAARHPRRPSRPGGVVVRGSRPGGAGASVRSRGDPRPG